MNQSSATKENADKSEKEPTSREADFYNSLLRLVVHDISTPLSVSMVILKRLQKKFGEQDQNADIERLRKANSLIVEILSQVRQFMSITSGKIEMSLVECDVRELLNSTLDLQEELFQKKDLKIEVVGHHAEVRVSVEPSIFKSVVLSNLINNAIKFSYVGGKIDIAYGLSTNEEAFVRIVDHGVGIPTELLPRLFDPSFPTHRKGTHGEDGVGFGLPLVKLFIGHMKGNITVASQNLGSRTFTCFEIRLPVYSHPC